MRQFSQFICKIIVRRALGSKLPEELRNHFLFNSATVITDSLVHVRSLEIFNQSIQLFCGCTESIGWLIHGG